MTHHGQGPGVLILSFNFRRPPNTVPLRTHAPPFPRRAPVLYACTQVSYVSPLADGDLHLSICSLASTPPEQSSSRVWCLHTPRRHARDVLRGGTNIVELSSCDHY